MSFTFDLRARPHLVVLACVAAAIGAGLLILQRQHRADESSVSPSTTPSAVAHRPAAKPAARHAAPATPKPRPAPKSTPKPEPAVAATGDRLPAAIRRAFAANRVVVVSLYDPRAKIDMTALREARAGTELTDAAFVPIDVRKNAVAALNAKYGVMQDPAVLVLKPSGDLLVRIDGFADRDTVAQAAADAGS